MWVSGDRLTVHQPPAFPKSGALITRIPADEERLCGNAAVYAVIVIVVVAVIVIVVMYVCM